MTEEKNIIYYDEGETCPNCEDGSLFWTSPNKDDGISKLKCDVCCYDATEDEK